MVPAESVDVVASRVGIAITGVREVVGFICDHADVVKPDEPATWPETDPADRWVAAAALIGAADVLVTGDRDLLDARPAAGLRVVTPRGLWELLRTT